MIGDVSIGTGFAGPFGSFSILLFRGVLNIKNEYLFMIELPTVFLYLVSFYWLTLQKKKYHFISEDNLFLD